MRADLAVDVVAIFGPTAAGKSAVAEALADLLGTEIVSADALQVYRGLPILTNQPARPTRLVAFRALHETMSIGEYAPRAHREIDDVVEHYGVTVVTGGSGLYLRAALAELDVPPAPAPGVRERIAREVEADPAAAHTRLRSLDEPAAEIVHPNDRRRLVRALELAETGSTLAPMGNRLWTEDMRRPTLLVGLDVSRDELRRRIERRTDAMFTAGVAGEVQAAIARGVSHTAEVALGLREIAELPEGQARARLVERTIRYADYQRKWLRRLPGALVVDGGRAPDVIAAEIAGHASAAGR